MDSGWHSLDVSWTGRSVAGAGDVDGDGVDDLLVGAPCCDLGRGAAYVVHGALVGDVELASAGTRILGEDGDELGYTVRRLGDLDGDGLADFAVGTQDADGTGFYLFHGPALGVSSPSEADASFRNTDGSGSGTWLCAAEDVDGDGAPDVWVNDSSNDTPESNAGGVLLLPGPLTGALDESASVAVVHGASREEHAGPPACVGDMDGDGRGDLAMGSGYGGPGSVYVMLAPFTGTRTVAEAIARFEGDGDDNARYPVAGGDIDGDGLGDLLIGGPGDDDGGTDAGAV